MRFLIGNTEDRVDAAHSVKGAPEVWASLINAGTVRKDDFEGLQTELKMIQERTLVAVQDLISAGLTFPEAIFHTVVSTENVQDMDDAKVDINTAQLGNDDTVFGITSVPLPIIHKTFSIPWRQEGLDYKRSTGVNRALRKIMEASDNLVVNGDSSIAVTVNGALQTLYGYTSHPNRTTRTITDWVAATTSLLSDVNNMLSDMFNTNKITAELGSINMYVSNSIWMILRQQAFSAKGEQTFMAQILKDYPEIGSIRPLESLTTKNVLMIYMRPESVQLAIAASPVVVPHVKQVTIAPQTFTGYAVWTPIIHVDSAGLTGVVHGAP